MTRRKQLLTSFILLIVITFTILFLSQTVRKINSKKEEYQFIPAFSLPDLDGNLITEKSLTKNTAALFLFFNPECDLCHSELKEISAHSDDLNKCQMVFFAIQPTDSIKSLLKNIAFNRTPNMFFLVDEKDVLCQTMEIQGPPTAIIYDRNGKLIKRFNGPVKIETLIKYLSE
jgi:peroxiredoxin